MLSVALSKTSGAIFSEDSSGKDSSMTSSVWFKNSEAFTCG
jgi:hypothetical protein